MCERCIEDPDCECSCSDAKDIIEEGEGVIVCESCGHTLKTTELPLPTTPESK